MDRVLINAISICSPFPEIALRFSCNGTPKTVHLDAEGLDLVDIPLDGERKLRIDAGDGSGGRGRMLETLEAFEAVATPEQQFLRVLMNLRERSSASSFHDKDGDGSGGFRVFLRRRLWKTVLRTVSFETGWHVNKSETLMSKRNITRHL